MKRITTGMRAGALGALLALAYAPASADEGSWVLDGELTATHDSNVGRAERERDIVADQSVLANIGLVLLTEPSFSTALNFRAFVEGEAWASMEALDRGSAGGQVTGRWAPLRGYRAPVFQLVFTGQVDDYGVHQRDSRVYTTQLAASQRVNDRIRVSYGVEDSLRISAGSVFDIRQQRAFVNADLDIDRNWNLYTAYSYLHGDTFSTAQVSFCNGVPANDIFGLISASTALEPDKAFNDSFCGSWLTYRLKAQTHALTLGVNRGFGHHLSADVSVQGVQVLGQGDNDYQRVLVRAGLLARF